MKAFYEEYRDDDENLIVMRNGFYLFPPHFHRNIEILIVNKGAYTVVHNGVSYSVETAISSFAAATICTLSARPKAKSRMIAA